MELEAQALLEYQSRRKSNPLYHFKPQPKLVPFYRSRARIRMDCGGNRSGKTHGMIAEACAYGLGFRPWALREKGIPEPKPIWRRPDELPDEAICWSTKGIRVQVPNTVMIVTGQPAKRGIGETIWPKILDLIGPYIEKVYYGQGGVPSHCVLKNGSHLIFGSAEQKEYAHESTNHAAYFIDEPIPKRVYTGIRRGSVDQGAPITFAFTPLGKHAGWMFNELYRRADGRGISVFHVSIFDNPYLSKEEVEAFANDPTISDVEKLARLYGKFTHLVDSIYPNFEESVHLVDSFEPPEHWHIIHSVDPHNVRPWAMAWGAITPRGEIVWYREWPTRDFTTIRRDTRTIAEYAHLIRRIEGTRPADLRVIDPNAGPRKDVVKGHEIGSFVQELGRHGLHYYHRINDALAWGEARVRALLAFDRDRAIDATNRPKMYITRDCINIRNSLSFYTAANRNSEDDMPDEMKRDETYKDFADVVRYAVASPFMDYVLHDSFYNLNNLGDPDEAAGDCSEYWSGD